MLLGANLFCLFLLTSTLLAETEFTPLEVGNNCFSNSTPSRAPQCNFSIANDSIDRIKVACLNIRSVPALRIIGEFHILRILCSSTHPIYSHYFGIEPTEATFVKFWKEIEPQSSSRDFKPKILAYVAEVQIYSVEALFELYAKRKLSNDMTKPHGSDYSRSGSYVFRGPYVRADEWEVDIAGTTAAFFIYLEDSAKPSLLRMNRVHGYHTEDKLTVPCVSSHYDTARSIEVDLRDAQGIVTEYAYNPVHGFDVRTNTLNEQNYTCIMRVNGTVVDVIEFSWNGDEMSTVFENAWPQFIQPESLPTSTIEFASSVEYSVELQREVIRPICRLKDLNTTVNPLTVLLITMPAPNWEKMRSAYYFVLPEHTNRSYTARTVSQQVWNSTSGELKMSIGTTLKSGVAFCRIGRDTIYTFIRRWDCIYGTKCEGNSLLRRAVKILNGTEKYVNTTISFRYEIDTFNDVAPIVWYTRRKNGSVIQEFIDKDPKEGMSVFSKRLGIDVQEVACSHSYSNADFWNNSFLQIALTDGKRPSIISTGGETEHRFKLGSTDRHIKCHASGAPVPRVYFKRNHEVLARSNHSEPFVIYSIGSVEEETFGTYICLAENELGSAEREFHVGPEETSLTPVMVSIAVFILTAVGTMIGACIYIKFFRPERIGLSKNEIRDFAYGVKQEHVVGTNGNLAHNFAQACPYTKSYEIDSSRFSIDATQVLGSGAYGTVLSGKLDDQVAAVKTIKRNAEKQYLKALLTELKIMIYLGEHPNLVKLFGAFTKELKNGIVYVFVELYPLGNLEGFLREHGTRFSHSDNNYGNLETESIAFDYGDLLKWTTQIADGMLYLSDKKVIHGDLATRNILLDAEKNARITDFGLSRQLYECKDYVRKHQEPLPWRWMALESLKRLSFSTMSDVWAFGVTIWEIFSLGEVPYPGFSWTFDFVDELERGLRMSRPKYATEEMYVTLLKCWETVPERRPSFQVLRDHFESTGMAGFMNDVRCANAND